jgi:putative heme degradation protein
MSPRVPKNFLPVEQTIFAANPLVAGIPWKNVTVRGGRASIPLGNRWGTMVEGIHAFGPVLSIARNTHAVLGRIGGYPKVFCASCGHCAAAADGTAEFYFGRWHRAEVSVEEKSGAWLYTIEFLDAWNETLHRICLTPDSDFEAFCEWVEGNQDTGSAEEFSSSRPRGGCSAVTTPPPGEGAIFLRAEVFEPLFDHWIAEKKSVQAVVGNESFVQGADLRPLALRATGQWMFVSDESHGLHLRTGRLAEICVQRVQWGDQASNLVLKAYEPEGRLALVLAPPRETSAPNWDHFLQELVRPFQIPAS